MTRHTLTINDAGHEVDCDPGMPLLWVLRDRLGLTGTKYGCGIGACGACTVHLDGAAVRSCQLPIGACSGRSVRTIEGLSDDGTHPVQRAWSVCRVAQCGYCQAGQMMTAAALLAREPAPDQAQLEAGMNGVLCRCGTYPRIRRALAQARELSAS